MLDLFCCQGGGAKGYALAGFDHIDGWDIAPQPRYPFHFQLGNALLLDPSWIARNYDAVHASPPCQFHTRAWKLQKREHPQLIAPTRNLLEASGLPYVIENVEGARDELRDPALLCGDMEPFAIETYRHRLFETNWGFLAPEHHAHTKRTAKMGRAAGPDEFMHIVGNFSGVDRAREIMAMPWANRDGLREAIPPAYTEFIGRQLLEVI
jgi:DNA (cytosine-5)-methyltransferase 1